MKLTLTLEDTHGGVNMHIGVTPNSVQNHMQDSLSCMAMVAIETALMELKRKHALVLTRHETHAAY